MSRISVELFANVMSSLKLLMNCLTHCDLTYPFRHLNVSPGKIYIYIEDVDMVQQLIEPLIAEDCRNGKQRPACHAPVVRAPGSQSPSPTLGASKS